MTEIEKTEKEIAVLQKKLELLKEIETHKSQPRMNFELGGKFEIVSYNGENYYRYQFNDKSHTWYKRKFTVDGMMMVRITDGETRRLLEGVWFNDVKRKSMMMRLLNDDEVAEPSIPSMINCIIRGNPPNGCSSWSEWFELFGSKGILHNLNISAKEYQPTEPPKPKHLQQIIQECFDDKMNIHTIPDIIDRIEKEWTPLNLNQKENRGFTDGYSMGFDDALNLVRKTLR